MAFHLGCRRDPEIGYCFHLDVFLEAMARATSANVFRKFLTITSSASPPFCVVDSVYISRIPVNSSGELFSPGLSGARLFNSDAVGQGRFTAPAFAKNEDRGRMDNLFRQFESGSTYTSLVYVATEGITVSSPGVGEGKLGEGNGSKVFGAG